MNAMTAATPITPAAGTLEAVVYNRDGLVPAIVQDYATGTVLMLAWMDDEALRRTLRDGQDLVLEPFPPGVLVQGRDLRRPAVRP